MKKFTIPSGTVSRREFLGATTAAAAFTIVPRHVLGGPGYVAPGHKLNIGCVGVGGRGVGYSGCQHGEHRCTVRRGRHGDCQGHQRGWSQEPAAGEAKKYRDFRQMLEKEKLDAITVSTPDHTHAVVAVMAMQMKKHVFVQKPLTHTIQEARTLAKLAKEMGVTTQMGNQGHAGEGARLVKEWIDDGALGDISEVHVWTNRPIWPQGINAPDTLPSVPPTLDWNLWLGPAYIARITRPIARSYGVAGGISGPARSETWALI